MSTRATYKMIVVGIFMVAFKAAVAATDLDSLLFQLEKTIQSDKAIDSALFFQLNLSIGQHLMHDGNHDLAIEYLLESLPFSKSDELKVAIYNEIGKCYSYQTDYPEAIHYFSIGDSLNAQLPDSLQLASINHNLGENYSFVGEIEQMKAHFDESIRLRYVQKDTVKGLYDQGLKYYYSGSYHNAIHTLREAIDREPEYLLRSRLYAYLRLSQRALGRNDQLVDLARMQMRYAHKTGNKMSMLYAIEALAESFDKIQELDSARYYQNIYLSESLELSKSREIQQATSMNLFYKYKDREREVLLLGAENKFQKMVLQQQKRTQSMTIIILAVLALFTLGLVWIARLRKEKIRIIEQQQIKSQQDLEEKKLLLREVNHRVKNNLQMIDGILFLQQQDLSKEVGTEVIQETRDRIRSIATLQSHLHESQDVDQVHMPSYTQALIQQITSTYSGQKIRIEQDIADCRIALDDAMVVALILNELITNSIKYATVDDALDIYITFMSEEMKLKLTVFDNGSKELEKREDGFGLELIRSLILKYDGALVQTWDNGMKTEVVLNL